MTDRAPSRNLTAKDLGLELFCAGVAQAEQSAFNRQDAGCKPAASTNFEFNEEDIGPGPDPHDCEVESEMEREARDGDQRGS